jgi:NAD(P)-dependent dehydrogenase (short-subunit alcohol dehydrogenase family)
MAAPSHGPILITGCSSGIGRAAALRLVRSGHVVYATARRPETLDDLAAEGAHTLALDVTDERSMTEAVAEITQEHGRVGALINNAGYGEYGPIEEVPIARVRAQFETNVFGAVRLCQLVLPGMREHGAGNIINVGSVGGHLTLPLGGLYHASKHALRSINDALRMETEQFGISVVLVEPGMIATEFNGTISGTLETEATVDVGPYAAMKVGMKSALFGKGSERISGTPDDVARVIERALGARRPRTRYLVTPMARVIIGTKAILPDRGWDIVAKRSIGS